MKSTVEQVDTEELLEILSEEAPTGVCIMQDGRFCYINSKFPIAIGYTVDELVGKDSLEIVVPEDREMVRENTMKMLKGELSSPYQFRVICKDGNIVWVMATVKSVQYNGRRAVLGNYMEITERKQMEEALKESEESYRELANSITDVFFAMDEHLRYTYWNKASEILTGIRGEDAIGKSLPEIFPDTPEIRRAKKVYREVLRTQKPQTFVTDYTDRDGRHYIFEISAYPSRGGVSVFVKDITERKQAEEALRESEERYRALFDRSLDCIYVHDFEGNFLDANKTALKLLGYKSKDLSHLNFASLLSQDQLPKALAALQELKDTGAQKQVNEFRLRCKDGSFVDVEVIAAVIYHDGKPYAVQGVGRDITEHKQADEKLKESEQKYRLLFETALDCIAQIDREGRYLAANPATAKSLGVPVDELIGNTVFEVVPQEVAQHRLGMVRKALDEWQPQIFEDERAGRYFHHIVIPTKNSEPKEAVQVITRDITERKKAEEALRQSEGKYRTILEEMEDAYFEVDLGGHFTFVNNSVCRNLGYSREELIGMSYKDFTAEDDIESVFRVFNEVYQIGMPNKGFPWKTIHKDGTRGFTETSISLLRNDKGEIIGFRGVGRDVTERKKAEERIKESEQKYRLIFETSLDCIAQIDREGRYLAANPATARSLGVPLEELVGKRMLEVQSQKVAQYRLGMVRKALDEWQPQIFEDERAGRYFHHIYIPNKTSDHKEAVQVIARDITERRKMEEALRHSEEKHRALFDSSVIGMFVMDAETMKIVMANQAVARMMGFSSVEEAIGINPIDFVHPEDKDKALEITVKEMFEQDLRRTREYRVVNKDGREGWVSVTGARIMHEGKLAGLVSTTDITERKQAVETLRQSEERYRTILEEMEDAYFEVDLGGHLTFVNNATCRALGYSNEELMGMSYKDFTVEEDIESVFRAFNEVYRTGKPNKSCLWTTVSKDGTHRFVEHSAFPLRNDKGEIIGFRGVGRDVTERKEMEEALNLQRAYFQQLFDNSPDAIVMLDINDRLSHTNKGFEALFGYSTEELQGQSIRKLIVPKEDTQATSASLQRVFSGEVVRRETVRRRKDGSLVDVSTLSYPIHLNYKVVGACLTYTDITERKQSEETLRQSKERYRALFDSSVTGTLVIDAETMQVVLGNQAAAKMFGFSSLEEAFGVNLLDFVPPEEKEKTLELMMKEVFEQDSRRAFDLQTMTKDGRKLWISATGARIMHKDRLAGLLSFTDITERKQAEEKLRQSEENYKTLFNSSVVGMYVMDAETMKVVMGNRAAREMIGFSSAEEGIGVNPFNFVVPEDREKVLEIAINEFLEDSRQTHEIRVMDKNGRRGWQSISIARIMHKGRLASLVSFADITERKRMEEALRQSEENYRALFDSSVIGTIVIDAETMKLVMANQAAAKMFGLSSAEEALELDPLDFFHPEDKEKIVEIAEKNLFEQDSQHTYELRAVTKDGREIWISATGARIMHEGRLAGLISFTDITEQKRQNERLMMTDRLASIGELAAGTAHELNNPLTTITGFSQLLMEKEVSEDIRQDLKLIYSEAQRAANVTKNLLTFARKHTPVKQLNQINNIIEDILKLRAYEHKANGIEVKRQFAPNLPEILVDYFQMQQVFLNLIINAEYFITEAHNRGTLTIATKKQNSTVRISIADDGPGIPQENLSRLFDPFFTTKEAGKGTGLGLSICHGIVTEHGGQIYAKSQQGKGATIFVELPINSR